jgi:hypothetical protein
VLRQILNACTGGEHRRMPTQAPARRIRGQQPTPNRAASRYSWLEPSVWQ